MTETLIKIALIAVLIEAAIAIMKPMLELIEFKYETYSIANLIAYLLGWIAAHYAGINLFSWCGASRGWSVLCTGVFIGRVASYTHNKLGRVRKDMADIITNMEIEQDETKEQN